MNEETEKAILRRLANLETHIINLIHPIQGICKFLSDKQSLTHLEKLLSQPLKIEESSFRCLVRQLEILLKDVNKNVEKLDIAQTYGEIKFIGKKLHQIEADIAEIKKEGIKKKIDLHFECDGYELVKKNVENITNKNSDDILHDLLKNLSENQRKSIIHRLGLFGIIPKKTYVALGKILGVSNERASQIYKRSLRILRHASRRSLVEACGHKGLIKEVLGED